MIGGSDATCVGDALQVRRRGKNPEAINSVDEKQYETSWDVARPRVLSCRVLVFRAVLTIIDDAVQIPFGHRVLA